VKNQKELRKFEAENVPMSDIIKLLPDHVANQIAAGEVIQRPASVVKELLENALDAQATEIKLIIKDGGRTSIQVLDNGVGMSETDARMAWERHATSKISTAGDLFKLNTMGFRGEALASIASVAHVEMKTRKHNEEVGTLLAIEGSHLKRQEPVSVMPGTSITVKNLFFNVPARRNFLKSNPVESKYIIDEFMRVALACPHLSLYMYNNDQEVFALKAATLGKRIKDIYTDRKDEQLLEVAEKTSVVSVQGYVGSPDSAKKTRGEQYFFVNGRFFKDPYLNHAVVAAYEELIPKDCYPLYILHLEIAPDAIDVNVHPQKTEIKFSEEKIIYQMIRSVVKRALGKYIQTPEMDFNPEIISGGANAPEMPFQPRVESKQGYNPFSPQTPRNGGGGDWKKMFDPYAGQSFSERYEKEQEASLFPVPELKTAASHLIYTKEYENSCFQLHNSYILSQVKNGLLILDQQAAHERILFERYLASFENQKLPTQEKLFPKVIELDAADFELLSELTDDLARLGFDISAFGKNTVIVNGIPADVKSVNEQELVEGMLESYKLGMTELRLEKRENLARSMARRTCIKGGDALGATEMMQLVEQLFACENPNYSPDGKPIFGRVGMADLQQLLGKR
jgi:DNA mismatch repair protein MutL